MRCYSSDMTNTLVWTDPNTLPFFRRAYSSFWDIKEVSVKQVNFSQVLIPIPYSVLSQSMPPFSSNSLLQSKQSLRLSLHRSNDLSHSTFLLYARVPPFLLSSFAYSLLFFIPYYHYYPFPQLYHALSGPSASCIAIVSRFAAAKKVLCFLQIPAPL